MQAWIDGLLELVLSAILVCIGVIAVGGVLFWISDRSKERKLQGKPFFNYTLASIIRITAAVGLWFGTARYFYYLGYEQNKAQVDAMRADFEEWKHTVFSQDNAFRYYSQRAYDQIKENAEEVIKDTMVFRKHFVKLVNWYDENHPHYHFFDVQEEPAILGNHGIVGPVPKDYPPQGDSPED